MNLNQIGLRFASWLQSARHSPRHRQLLFAAASLIFVAAFLLSYQHLPEVTVNWRWLLLIVPLVPATLVVAGLEYQICGRVLGHQIPLHEAIRVSLLSMSANLLPLPGSVIVRTQALGMRGSKYGHAISSTAAIGTGWLATALLAAGVLHLMTGNWRVSLLFGLPGAAALALTAALIRLVTSHVFSAVVRITAIEVVFVLIAAVRLYAALKGIGLEPSPTQATTLTIAAALASAAGVFPGGLGLRELIAGALSPLASLSVAGGVLAAAVDRLVGLILLAAITAALLPTLARRGSPADHQPVTKTSGEN